MIKLTINPKVLIGLQEAFSSPANSAARALAKYLAVVEGLIFDAIQRGITPEQRKLKVFPLPLHDLANRGGRIGSEKTRMHKWLKDNNLEIVETVVKGNKFIGEYSLVKLSKLAAISGQVTFSSRQLDAVTSDKELDRYLTGNEEDNLAIFNHLYPDINTSQLLDTASGEFDFVPVDIGSVKAFIVWLSDKTDLSSQDKRARSLIHAKTILAVASVAGGLYPQRRKPSPFGRIYYEGVSIQNVHKELRRAILGNCWEYDMRSSVVSWKMGFAKRLLSDAKLPKDVRTQFPATTLYLEDKTDFMRTVRYFTFEGNTKLTHEFQLSLIKKALTAISFGAKNSGSGWIDSLGKRRNPALVDILMNKFERQNFLSDPTVKAFIAEQHELDDYIFSVAKKNLPELMNFEFLKTASGRLSKSKLLSYLYQHAETNAMDMICTMASNQGKYPIARVHDAIFFKHRLGADLKHEIELTLQESTCNKYWHLAAKQLSRYTPVSLDAIRDESEHKQRIKLEEQLAAQYFQ
ncbi:MAG: hypothetical protein ACKVOY_04015 [Burkholderiaceae bacterium]